MIPVLSRQRQAGCVFKGICMPKIGFNVLIKNSPNELPGTNAGMEWDRALTRSGGKRQVSMRPLPRVAKHDEGVTAVWRFI